MGKAKRLCRLHEKMEADGALAFVGVANLVFGEGDPDGDVLFIGEAPGAREDELVRPFVGRSGTLLSKWLESIGWRREEVYITNIVKRRPPDNRDPLPDEISAYSPYLKEQIDIIGPKIIAPLGRFAMNFFLPDARISHDQGRIFLQDERIVMPIFHPAAAFRNRAIMRQSEETFRKLKSVAEKYEAFLALWRKRGNDVTCAPSADELFEHV